MAAQGYRNIAGVLDLGEETALRDMNNATAQHLRTKGRYKPHGVSHRKDREPDDDGDDRYYQKIRRKAFVSTAPPVNHGAGTNRVCAQGEDEVYGPQNQKYCRKKCSAGWRRNPTTHRCYKEDAVRRRRFECRVDYGRNNATGRCKKIRNGGGDDDDDDDDDDGGDDDGGPGYNYDQGVEVVEEFDIGQASPDMLDVLQDLEGQQLSNRQVDQLQQQQDYMIQNPGSSSSGAGQPAHHQLTDDEVRQIQQQIGSDQQVQFVSGHLPNHLTNEADEHGQVQLTAAEWRRALEQ